MTPAHTLIVGGTRGIGRALVKRFARENQFVSVIGRHQPSEADARILGTRYWLADLSKRKRLSRVLSEIVSERGRLDNLVLCQRYRGASDDWIGEMDISLSMTKRVVESLCDDFEGLGGGSIVILSSLASCFIANEQPLSYHVAKGGLNQLVRYYAVVLGAKRIRVNAVSPATILKEESKGFYIRNKKLTKLYQDITPLGRMGTSEDVCNVISFLCSPGGSFITGQNIVVDGGISVQWHETLARKLTSLNGLRITRQTDQDA
jgi:NAD(P)-dependent dehydrogenase (short-subunit alcohol dehydrogenase family)